MYTEMIAGDVSPVKPPVPTRNLPIGQRPTPAVNIRVHLSTYEMLRRIKRPRESFDTLIRLLLARATPIEEFDHDQ